ncbi:hypothetical protein EVAR_87894_1 [Eumeta japonica]|uniref:Uncharacterized protein n=1 Tax=Eumeta variegata TaxID=151549 RepID=A0A4C1WU30_EUMVA|nr:hypothetical protein EVAR_87894_1 [Eumeta japonica]
MKRNRHKGGTNRERETPGDRSKRSERSPTVRPARARRRKDPYVKHVCSYTSAMRCKFDSSRFSEKRKANREHYRRNCSRTLVYFYKIQPDDGDVKILIAFDGSSPPTTIYTTVSSEKSSSIRWSR